MGRDIRLSRAKNKEPLNLFVYPYAEFGGGQFTNMDVEVTFKKLEGGRAL